MIDFEQEIILHGKQLSRVEESLIGIKISLDKLEIDPKNYVTCKIFIFVVTILTGALGYLYTK